MRKIYYRALARPMTPAYLAYPYHAGQTGSYDEIVRGARRNVHLRLVELQIYGYKSGHALAGYFVRYKFSQRFSPELS